MWKVSLRRKWPTPTRQRRQRHVSRLIWFVVLAALVHTWRRDGLGALAWTLAWGIGGLAVLAVLLLYVEWPERKKPPPIEDWAVTGSDPDARVYRGHPNFFYETRDEAHARRISGVPDAKVRPRQPDAVKVQRRGGRGLFQVKRRPYETEFAAALEKMLERRRGELETCESPAALITETLVEAMGGDEPDQESRDWFVTTVLARVESDRYWARLPPLEDARAKWREGT